MGVVLYRLRADLRSDWRTIVLLSLAVGIGGGLALVGFAGARRTASAMPQFLAYTLPDDGAVAFPNPPRSRRPYVPNATELRVLQLPEVAAYGVPAYLFMK